MTEQSAGASTNQSNRPLSGRTALVTGAASGIGRAITERFAEDGARVIAVDRDADRLGKVCADTGATPLVVDLSDIAGLPGVIAEFAPSVDILVNDAGIQHVERLEDFPIETFETILRIMLTAPFVLTRAVLPGMYERGWGRIIHVSSAHGRRASPFKSAYVTAKHGLEGLSKVIALEGASKGVTSNCINPGYVRTPLVEKQIVDQARQHGIGEDEVVEKIMLTPVAVKRLVEPDEVAELAAVLYGPASASLTGTSLTLDGGWTAH
jgi:3-hydroxybutyrate dehydrogenase